MYVQELLRERAAIRPPGAGRAHRGRQVRLDVPRPGALDRRARGDRHRGPRSGPRPRRVPHRGLERRPPRPHALHRRCDGSAALRRRGRGGRSDGRPRGGNLPRPRRVRERQAHRDGERRGGRPRRTAAGGGGARRRCRLHHGLRRPARAHLRDGGVGAGERLRRGGRGQGHQVPAVLPRLDAGHGVGSLRAHRRAGAGRGHEQPDVQLLPRRHEVRDRDGGESPTPPA